MGSFEVFDDIAFYWFLQVILGLFLIPYSFSALWSWWFSTKIKRVRQKLPKHLKPKIRLRTTTEDDEQQGWRRYLSLTTIVVAALWVLFILLLVQLPRFHNKSMYKFDPYEILDLEPPSTERKIKRAYRKASLRWHPDKASKNNLSKEEAEKQFILIAKAYQTLSDPATKENYEKYGNPDGYQGTSITIGLPSWMTDKNYHLYLLLGYFGCLVVLVLLVFFWWQHNKRFHISGASHDTMTMFFNYIKPGSVARKLIEVLATSSEFKELDYMLSTERDRNAEARVKDLAGYVGKYRGRPLFKDDYPYVSKAATLMVAYMANEKIDGSLEDARDFVIREAPRLLDVMVDMTHSKGYHKAMHELFKLKQHLAQGIWIQGRDAFEQLPFRHEGDFDLLRAFKKAKINSLKELLRAHEEKVQEALLLAFPDIDDEEKSDAGTVVVTKTNEANKEKREAVVAAMDMFPNVTLRHCARVVGEKEIQAGDLITITIRLERRKRGPMVEMQVVDGEEKEVEIPECASFPPPPEDQKIHSTKSYSDDDALNFVDSDIQDDKRLNLSSFNAPIVHSLNYPYESRERWVVVLLEKSKVRSGPRGQQERVVEQVRNVHIVPDLSETASYNFPIRYGETDIGKKRFEVHAWCDSYVGLDLKHEFDFMIVKKPPENEQNLDEFEREGNIAQTDRCKVSCSSLFIGQHRKTQEKVPFLPEHVLKRSGEVWATSKDKDAEQPHWIELEFPEAVEGIKRIILEPAQLPFQKEFLVPETDGSRKLQIQHDIHIFLDDDEEPWVTFEEGDLKKGQLKYESTTRPIGRRGRFTKIRIQSDHEMSFGRIKIIQDLYGIEEVEYIPEGKWYYLGAESFVEFVLTLFMLYFIYLIVVSGSWGKKYIQPWVDWGWERAVHPVLAVMTGYTYPLYKQAYEKVYGPMRDPEDLLDEEEDRRGREEDDL